MRKSCLSLAVLLLTVVPLSALADEASHRQAAEELLKAADGQKIMQTAIDQMLEAQIKAQPRMAKYRGVMRKFLNKYLGYESLKDDMIKLYTEEFTEKELQEITAFYRTPTGKKAIAKMPSLMSKGAQLGLKKVMDHQDELRKLIAEEDKKPN